MVRSHAQHERSGCIPSPAGRATRAMSGGGAASADDRASSPSLGDGEREERDAAAGGAAAAMGTAPGLASEVAEHVKGGAGSTTEPTAGEGNGAAAANFGKDMLEEILQLKKQQKEAREAKAAVQKQLRNAERRRKRLKQRAKQLSDADLLAVISLRHHEKTLSQRDGRDEDAESMPDDPGAASSGEAPKASTKPSSKKQRHS